MGLYDTLNMIWIGMIVGYVVAVIVERRQQRQSLELSAMCATPQKINDSFYYIVPESRYVQMQIDALKAHRLESTQERQRRPT